MSAVRKVKWYVWVGVAVALLQCLGAVFAAVVFLSADWAFGGDFTVGWRGRFLGMDCGVMLEAHKLESVVGGYLGRDLYRLEAVCERNATERQEGGRVLRGQPPVVK